MDNLTTTKFMHIKNLIENTGSHTKIATFIRSKLQYSPILN